MKTADDLVRETRDVLLQYLPPDSGVSHAALVAEMQELYGITASDVVDRLFQIHDSADARAVDGREPDLFALDIAYEVTPSRPRLRLVKSDH